MLPLLPAEPPRRRHCCDLFHFAALFRFAAAISVRRLFSRFFTATPMRDCRHAASMLAAILLPRRRCRWLPRYAEIATLRRRCH